jgi:hypothetical protein
LICTLSTFYT